MSRTRIWYPHYIDDFNRKTGHLTLAERGAYRALIDVYWERQGPLPADERALCRLISAFPDEWEEVRENVLGFFKERDGKLYHTRIEEEIKKAAEQHAEKAERMARAREKRWAEKQHKSDQSADQSSDQKADQPRGSKIPSPSPSHILKDTEEPDLGAKAPSQETPRAILESVLEPEDAEAVLDHRKKLRKPMTERAAKLLVGELSRCRDGPKAGAEMMILRGWQSFKADWYENERARNDQRNGKAPGVVDDLCAVIDRAKDFDRAGREPVPGDEPEPRRRALGFG